MKRATQRQVNVRYTNYKGETSNRIIRPINIRFGATEWHSEPQWLLKCKDMEKNQIREFSMKDIHLWGKKL